MQTKMLQTADLLLMVKFVKHLYGYASRSVNSSVKAQWSAKTGMSQRAFADKMNTHRSFKGQELDIVSELYKSSLGIEVFNKQLDAFIDKRDLDLQNEGLADAQLLISNNG